MAQFVMSDLVKKEGLSKEFFIDSKATSTEEIGNPPHPGTVKILKQMNIPVLKHSACQMTKEDYNKFDLIIGMDENNYRNIMRIIKNDPEGKVSLLLDYTKRPGQIADPWYTGNFLQTFTDVMEGCQGLLKTIIQEKRKSGQEKDL